MKEKCKICGERFNKMSEYYNHIRKEHRIKIIKEKDKKSVGEIE